GDNGLAPLIENGLEHDVPGRAVYPRERRPDVASVAIRTLAPAC
nr:hypothetical protein [Tanacetum cinerariifolium]